MSKRLDGLTSLRWFAALAVFGRHLDAVAPLGPVAGASHLFPQGAAGVSFFFILSGFVLTWSRRASDSTRNFFVRRFARIYPAYLAVCVASILLRTIGGKPLNVNIVPSLVLVQAWIPRASVYYGLNAVNWSLSVEAFFYAVFPLVVIRAMTLSSPQRKALIAGSLASTFVLAALLHPSQGTAAFWILYVFPPVRFLEFLVGILLALEIKDNRWPVVRVGQGLAVVAAAYLAAGFVSEPFMWVATTVVPFTVLIGAAAMSDARGAPSVLHDRRFVWLGGVSYAFYLVHIVFIEAINRALHSSTGVLVLALPCGLVAAAALYYVVERPAERRIRSIASRVKDDVV